MAVNHGDPEAGRQSLVLRREESRERLGAAQDDGNGSGLLATVDRGVRDAHREIVESVVIEVARGERVAQNVSIILAVEGRQGETVRQWQPRRRCQVDDLPLQTFLPVDHIGSSGEVFQRWAGGAGGQGAQDQIVEAVSVEVAARELLSGGLEGLRAVDCRDALTDLIGERGTEIDEGRKASAVCGGEEDVDVSRLTAPIVGAGGASRGVREELRQSTQTR